MIYDNRPAVSCFKNIISKKGLKKNNINKKRSKKINDTEYSRQLIA